MILGLDISTAVTGIARIDAADGSLVDLDFVDTRKCITLWDSIDAVRHRLSSLSVGCNYSNVFVEESVQRFRSGFSSAHTISTLAKMNGTVSYLARLAFCVEPQYISSARARKLCGIIVARPKSANEKKDDHFVKRQVYNGICHVYPQLLSYAWPYTRPSKKNPNGRMRDECFDMVDAIVVARAGWEQLTAAA